MDALRVILGDQLSANISSLHDMNPDQDAVLMMEVVEETTYVSHHPQKIAFILSAMRHFAEELRAKGYRVLYVALDEGPNNDSFDDVVAAHVKQYHPKKLIVTEPGEYRVLQKIQRWQSTLACDVEIKADDRFFCTTEDFSQWYGTKKQPRMESFYRWMRKKTGILMDEKGAPRGGEWNYDSNNRKKCPPSVTLPNVHQFVHDEITEAVLSLCESRFAKHFGDLRPFNWGVTRRQALNALQHFINECLPQFGDYQDAMRSDAHFLFHSALSPYLNIGLLSPKEVCAAAEQAYDEGHAPVNAVEGFIRQILGWREFVRGVYWHFMPDYAQKNALDANRKLPNFYWDGETDMRCLHHVISQTKQIAHSHHIQRLMVTGNYALLVGVAPEEICEWYLAVYIDAFDWVELPNTLGMVMHADGGIMGSKPYIASGNYINKMSDFCQSCLYNVKDKVTDDACPFNYLYWHFLLQHEQQLKNNPRLAFPYKQIGKMTAEHKEAINHCAKRHIEKVCQ